MTYGAKRFLAPALQCGVLIAIIAAVGGAAWAQRPSQQQVSAIRQACQADFQAHCVGVSPGSAPALACLQENLASLSPGCQQAVNAVAGPATAPPSAAPTAAKPPAQPPAAGDSPAPPAEPAANAPPPAAPAPAAPVLMRPNKAQASRIRAACRTDYQAYCAGITPGGSAALACLQNNDTQLSAACRQALSVVSRAAPTQAGTVPAETLPAATGPGAGPPVRVSPRQELFILRSACGRDYRSYCQGLPPGGGRLIGCLRSNAANLSPRCQRALIALGGGR